MKAFKLICKIGSVLCILSFLVISILWITNNQLIKEPLGYVIWGISIVLGGIIALLTKKYRCFDSFAIIALAVTILSVGLLIATGIISITVSSMP